MVLFSPSDFSRRRGVAEGEELMDTSSGTRRFPFFTAVLLVACVGLAVLVVVLSRQNRELRAELAAAEHAAQRGAGQGGPEVLKAGDRVAALTAVDSAGREVQVPLDAPGRRLVMIGSSQCTSCATAKPFWVELSAAAVAGNVSTVCLMTDGKADSGAEAELSMPVLGVREFPQSSIGRIPGVPLVLLVRDGVVERVWPGPFDVRGRDEVRAALQSGGG